jgi:hypothetical protein
MIGNITLEHNSSSNYFISLEGSGTISVKVVTIKGTSSSTADYSFIIGAVTSNKGGTIEFSDLKIDGLNFTSTSASNGAILELTGTIHVIVENIEIKNIASETTTGYFISCNDAQSSLIISISYGIFSYINLINGSLIYIIYTTEVSFFLSVFFFFFFMLFFFLI